MPTTTLSDLDKQIRETIANERRARFERMERDAARYQVLKAAGAADHAAIRADAQANGGDFDAALDRYAANLILYYFSKIQATA